METVLNFKCINCSVVIEGRGMNPPRNNCGDCGDGYHLFVVAAEEEDASEYQKAEISKARSLSNANLLEDSFLYAEPDDYDGVFTYEGRYLKDLYREELEERLKDWLESS